MLELEVSYEVYLEITVTHSVLWVYLESFENRTWFLSDKFFLTS